MIASERSYQYLSETFGSKGIPFGSKNRKEICLQDYIPFNLKGKWNLFFSECIRTLYAAKKREKCTHSEMYRLYTPLILVKSFRKWWIQSYLGKSYFPKSYFWEILSQKSIRGWFLCVHALDVCGEKARKIKKKRERLSRKKCLRSSSHKAQIEPSPGNITTESIFLISR